MYVYITAPALLVSLAGEPISSLQCTWEDMAPWHFPGGPVGPPARRATTSNVEEGSGTEEEAPGS